MLPYLIAPNGKRSNLTPKQWKLVRTPAFKKWFGDWENDPANASKVVDENGEPLVVYHGTDVEFNVFDKNYIGSKTYLTSLDGFHFAKDKTIANRYGLKIKSFFIGKGKLLFNGGKMVVTDNPNQIKLADGTNTTFDGNNPDIRFEKGGDVNNKIVIRKIRQKDIPEITRNLAQVFDKSGWTANQLWNTIGYIDPNLSVVAEYNNQLAGFYFFNPNDIPRMYGIVSRFDGKKGVEGVALGVFKKFKDKGIGKKLIEYSQNNLDFDYIWGYQMKVLDNINDWLKRREIYQEYSDMYITYQMLK